MSYSQGDVVLVAFPNADLTTYKQRPALIIQSDRLPSHSGDKLVACITSNTHKTGSTRVQIIQRSPEGQQMGLLMDSVIVAPPTGDCDTKETGRLSCERSAAY